MIKVDVPREIDEYKEKVMFGMSLRQLAGFAAAIFFGLGSFFICTKALGFSSDIASYVVMLLSIPPLAVGFVKIKGMYFEDYAKQFLEWKGIDNRKILIYEYQEDIEQEAPKKAKKKKEENLNEAIYTEPDFSQKSIKQRWENAKRYLEEA